MNNHSIKQQTLQSCALLLIATSMTGCFFTKGASVSTSQFSKLPNPVLDMSALNPILRGNYEYTIEYSSEIHEKLKLSKLELQFSEDGGKNFSTVQTLEPSQNSVKWLTPAKDIQNAVIRIVLADSRNNESIHQSQFEIRNHDPVIVPKGFPTQPSSVKRFDLSGTCEKGVPLSIEIEFSKTDGNLELAESSSKTEEQEKKIELFSCSDGTFSYHSSKVQQGYYSARFYQVDQVGHETELKTPKVLIDNEGPEFKISAFTLNQGIRTGRLASIPLSFVALDRYTPITELCIISKPVSEILSAEPTLKCWEKIANFKAISGKTVTINNLYRTIGDMSAKQRISYGVKLYARDQFGNTSEYKNTETKDFAIYDLIPALPVQIDNFVGTFSNLPTLNPEVNFVSGAQLKLFWRQSESCSSCKYSYRVAALSDTTPRPYVNISPTEISANSSNQTHSGTVTESLPSNEPFRILLNIVTESGLTNSASTPLLNADRFRTLAGNTNLGHSQNADEAASATATVFNLKPLYYDVYSTKSYSVSGGLVVLDNGIVIVRDFVGGLIAIEPVDGKAKQLLPMHLAGLPHVPIDGFLNQGAYIRAPYKIALDKEQNLWLFDFNAIRRISFSFTSVRSGSTQGVSIDRSKTRIDTFVGGYTADDETNGVIIPNLFKNRGVLSAESSKINVLATHVDDSEKREQPYIHSIYFDILPARPETGYSQEVVFSLPSVYYSRSSGSTKITKSDYHSLSIPVLWDEPGSIPSTPYAPNTFDWTLVRLPIGNGKVAPQSHFVRLPLLKRDMAIKDYSAAANTLGEAYDLVPASRLAFGSVKPDSSNWNNDKLPLTYPKAPLIDVDPLTGNWRQFIFKGLFDKTSTASPFTISFKPIFNNNDVQLEADPALTKSVSKIGATYAETNFFHSPAGETYFYSKMDGFGTQFQNRAANLFRFNPETNALDAAFEIKSVGNSCPDLKLSKDCSFDITDFYVGSDNRFYFLERGLVRMIDDSGRVATLFGQKRDFDGYESLSNTGLAQLVPTSSISARFGNINFLRATENGHLVVQDDENATLKNVGVNKNVTRILGAGANGAINTALKPNESNYNLFNWQTSLNFGLRSLSSTQFEALFFNPADGPGQKWSFRKVKVDESTSTPLLSFDTDLSTYFNCATTSSCTNYNSLFSGTQLSSFLDTGVGLLANKIAYSGTEMGGLVGYYADSASESAIRMVGRKTNTNAWSNMGLILHDLKLSSSTPNSWWLAGNPSDPERYYSTTDWITETKFGAATNNSQLSVSNPGLYFGAQMQGIVMGGTLKWATSAGSTSTIGLITKGTKPTNLLVLKSSLKVTPETGGLPQSISNTDPTGPDYRFYQILTYKVDDSSMTANSLTVYHCSTEGHLYKSTLNPSSTTPSTPISISRLGLPANIKCSGRALEILKTADNTRHLVFPYEENGLAAVGGYKLN